METDSLRKGGELPTKRGCKRELELGQKVLIRAMEGQIRAIAFEIHVIPTRFRANKNPSSNEKRGWCSLFCCLKNVHVLLVYIGGRQSRLFADDFIPFRQVGACDDDRQVLARVSIQRCIIHRRRHRADVQAGSIR